MEKSAFRPTPQEIITSTGRAHQYFGYMAMSGALAGVTDVLARDTFDISSPIQGKAFAVCVVMAGAAELARGLRSMTEYRLGQPTEG